ncbi:MAG: PEP-CTERM sorting domain-containing protein [Betaproteobacteria bacterium]|nr:PEP-CTERM sorting domain-containing protein [Betaproteobacteria bacterium]
MQAQVPEPGTLALVALATGGFALRRRQSGAGRWANHAPSASRSSASADRLKPTPKVELPAVAALHGEQGRQAGPAEQGGATDDKRRRQR